MLCVCVVHKAHNFVVGLTNVSPNISTPTLFNYTLCGQYPGSVPAAATVSLYCQDNLPPFRYVIVQFPLTNELLVACEVEVLVRGTKGLTTVSEHQQNHFNKGRSSCKSYLNSIALIN